VSTVVIEIFGLDACAGVAAPARAVATATAVAATSIALRLPTPICIPASLQSSAVSGVRLEGMD
jgi:hypothetical protein